MAKYRSIEQGLIQSETQLFLSRGLPAGKAREAAVAIVDKAIVAAKARGRYGTAPLGEWMLSNPACAPYFAWARQYYGVRDEDIREWWNLDEVERGVVEQDDAMAHMAGFLNAMTQGLSPEQAAAKVWHALPYCDFDFGRQADDKNRAPLLPAELKPRIVAYTEKCMRDGTKPTHDCATFNEWVQRAALGGDL
jgi:hypothetical protein